MAAYKRSDPTKIRRDREKIEADLEERMQVPQEARRYPSMFERARRFIDQKVSERKTAKNPPPTSRGAKVFGFTKDTGKLT